MRPRVILHNMVSVDGRTDGFPAPDLGLFYELVGRWKEDATLVGVDTIITGCEQEQDAGAAGGEPAEPDPSDSRPILVVPDSRGRLKYWDRVRRWPYWHRAVALCSKTTPPEYLSSLESTGVDSIIAGDDHVDYAKALDVLATRYGVKVLRVDSGGVLNGVLLRAGLVDEVSIVAVPRLVGGQSPRSMFRAPDTTSPDEALGLTLLNCEQLKDGVVWTHYEVKR
jgi:2,5-diamino-6-(ribosylamino)-4(3H)-pyrimidinone 5'-phosphate reductase